MRHLAAILIAFTAACATDGTDGTDDIDLTSLHGPNRTTRDPAQCHDACRVALGICTITNNDDKELLESCTAQCAFSDAELACYAAATCGSEPSCP